MTYVGTVHGSFVVTGQQIDDWHDMTDPPYRTHDPDSVTDNPRPHQATSIPAILRNETAVPTVGVGSVSFVEVQQSVGSSYTTRLGSGDLVDPCTCDTGFQDHVVPGFSADPDRKTVRFTRPMRNDDDLNYRDVWLSQDEGEASLVVHTSGRIVQPTIQTVASADAGTPVSFAVTYDGSPPPDPTYRWAFDDGTTATGASPTHTWSASGTYAVTLDVTGSDTSAGTATPVRVQVGPAPPPGTGTQTGTGTGGTNNTVTGPVKGKGKKPGMTTATQGSGTTGSGASAGSSTGAGAHPGQATAQGESAQGTKPQHPAEAGTQVSGTLLVSQLTEVAPAAPSAAAPASAARAAPRPTHDWRWLWTLALPALLLLGAAGQSRWLQRRLPTVPWRTT